MWACSLYRTPLLKPTIVATQSPRLNTTLSSPLIYRNATNTRAHVLAPHGPFNRSSASLPAARFAAKCAQGILEPWA